MKILFKLSLFLITCLFSSNFLLSNTLSGLVLDQNLQGIPGVYVFVKSTDNHGHSDLNGKFKIKNVSIGDTILTSHLGFQVTEYVVKNFVEDVIINAVERSIDLSEISIVPELDGMSLITNLELKINPVQSSQEILQTLPGIVIGQHAGGGKAEQIFFRGFDIDHGTDLAINVDGMPVNMVSHAHGQGYSDLHFLIPELIDNIEFSPGSYNASNGNFGTAGNVNFSTKERLKNSLVKTEIGQFNTLGLTGLFSVLNSKEESFYIATKYLATDGYFESSQNFQRKNIQAKYTRYLKGGDKLSFTSSFFNSEWDASGQIPQRKIDDGSITRFGAIDNTEGGKTSRTNFQLAYLKNTSENSFLKTSAYFSNYNFNLFSNFTFFLEDSINGDQIRQHEKRNLAGITTQFNKYTELDDVNLSYEIGLGLRSDWSTDNFLAQTKNRETILNYLKRGNVTETNYFTYMKVNFDFDKWVLIPGIRLDYFNFRYSDELISFNNPKQIKQEPIVSPKLNVIYNVNKNLQFYLKTGKGFHSNDSRVAVQQSNRSSIPASYGADLGGIYKPIPRIVVSGALWYLYLEQEFVYVGDAGIVEPSGESVRKGIDLNIRYQISDRLFFNSDVNYAFARTIDEEAVSNYIPLAPDLTANASVSYKAKKGFFTGFQLKYLDNRPANEDNSIIAEGYFLINANVGYEYKSFTLNVMAENVLNTEWNETQFATESRLQSENVSTEEIHFTPGTPLALRTALSFKF